MARRTRRDFLRQAALMGGATAMSGLGGFAASAQDAPAEMAIARWAGDKVPDSALKPVAVKLTEQAFQAVGGLGRFVKRGDVVWVKPNMAWNRTPEQANNTNPDVVATIVRLCLDAGAKTVKVGDNTCNPAEQAYPASGIEEAAKAAGAQIVYLDPNRFREIDLGGDRLKSWEVYPEIIEADLVINCPIAKHHGLTLTTLCMKNYMGVAGGKRSAWHQAMPECLTDITRFMKPRITLLDAVRILKANGPQGGTPEDVVRLDTVAVSTDVVALDAFGVDLLEEHIAGARDRTEARRILEVAANAGLGKIDYRALSPKEITVS